MTKEEKELWLNRNNKIEELIDKVEEVHKLLFTLERSDKIKVDEVQSYKGLLNFVRTKHITSLENMAEWGVDEETWNVKVRHVESVLATYMKELNERTK